MPSSRFPSLQSKPADRSRSDDDRIAREQANPETVSSAAILDPAQLPSWQRPFVLGPNVRFTRTPHRKQPVTDLQGRAPVESPAAALQDHLAAAIGAEPSSRPEEQAADAEPPKSEPEQPLGPVDFLSRPILPPRPEAAPTLNANDIHTMPVNDTMPIAAEAEDAILESKSGSFAFIPDTLAFEMMGLGLLDDVAVSPPVQEQAAEPVAESIADEIEVEEDERLPSVVSEPDESDDDLPSPVSLYRQVTVGARANTAPQEVQAAEPEPAVEVEEPVASGIDDEDEEDDWTQPVKDDARGLTREPLSDFVFPAIDLLQPPRHGEVGELSPEVLEQSAGLLESILEDFGVKGEIIDVRPGPVVTLYEFEPAPGVKSSRVINLSDDIARSMSALSARVAVIPGRNVIGIELPNEVRETVYLRELFESRPYLTTDFRLPLCLGKTIGGEPVIAELAKMPHLLVAGTTGSGKSVAINTMILSLLYHLRPEECRLIMVDPKMLELSVYDGIPHLLTPVVTDPKKAVLALKWAVREMEDRYRKMSRLGVRNIDGFNERVAEARSAGETIMVSVPTGFDRSTGEQTFEDQELDLSALPYIVVIVDEMADLMMVAGKEIEGTIQRLAQMARAAGIHLIMATQRPSVDVITGTIKANFPTRISFQVTSRIDSRTILGEQGAEYLLGQGDMLHMKGGGRISRVHGPFVSDHEVEKVVAHLKRQGSPAYLGSVTVDEEEIEEIEEDAAVFDATDMGSEDGDDLYEKAVKIIQRDKKCSTSYIQRRLSIGYNRAASLVERMEQEGLVGPANHVGKREILGTSSAN